MSPLANKLWKQSKSYASLAAAHLSDPIAGPAKKNRLQVRFLFPRINEDSLKDLVCLLDLRTASGNKTGCERIERMLKSHRRHLSKIQWEIVAEKFLSIRP